MDEILMQLIAIDDLQKEQQAQQERMIQEANMEQERQLQERIQRENTERAEREEESGEYNNKLEMAAIACAVATVVAPIEMIKDKLRVETTPDRVITAAITTKSLLYTKGELDNKKMEAFERCANEYVKGDEGKQKLIDNLSDFVVTMETHPEFTQNIPNVEITNLKTIHAIQKGAEAADNKSTELVNLNDTKFLNHVKEIRETVEASVKTSNYEEIIGVLAKADCDKSFCNTVSAEMGVSNIEGKEVASKAGNISKGNSQKHVSNSKAIDMGLG